MTFYPSDTLWALFELSIRISLVALVVGLALWALRIRGGAVIHAAWTAVIVTMLLLPVLPSFLPAIPIWVPERHAFRQWATRVETPVPPPIIVAPVRAAEAKAEPLPPAPAVTRTAAPVEAPAAPFPWSSMFVLVWAIVALALLARLAIGWRRALALAAASEPSCADPALLESDLIATPVTVGVFRPRTILPRGWTAWPAAMQSSVLQHERAHIRRRDTFVNLIAGVNRAVFWFHPLAWWLERRVAVAAEQACDDEVVAACGDSEHYASLLLSMADNVREHGGRVEWQAVGMAGGGSLSQRIDRVMSGVASTPTSRTRRLVLTTACVAAIGLGIACRQTVPPLRPDPAVQERLAKQKALGDKYEAARTMTLDQVAAAEAAVAKNPDDLDTTEKLLVFYRQNGQALLGWNEMVATRRVHLLRMIEHHPESDLAYWPFVRSLDPVGYAQARALWMKHVSAPDVTTKVLGVAAEFFRYSEKAVAEELFLRAKKMASDVPQPRANGLYRSSWSARLGHLYASAIIDADTAALGDRPSSPSPADPDPAFAAAARQKLNVSSDPDLLVAASSALNLNWTRGEGRSMTEPRRKVVLAQRALGDSLLDRAVALAPDAEATKAAVSIRKSLARELELSAKRSAVMGINGQVDAAKLAALSEAERLEVLPMLAILKVMHGEDDDWNHRPTAKGVFDEAKGLADEAIALSQKAPRTPQYGPSVYSAHVTRALAALRDGDRRLAVVHMRKATDVLRDGDVLDEWSSMGQYRLCNYLLSAGERESVAEFYERSSKFAGRNGASLAKSAADIRAGLMPEGYQYYVTPH